MVLHVSPVMSTVSPDAVLVIAARRLFGPTSLQFVTAVHEPISVAAMAKMAVTHASNGRLRSVLSRFEVNVVIGVWSYVGLDLLARLLQKMRLRFTSYNCLNWFSC